jgi:hypothetical protein
METPIVFPEAVPLGALVDALLDPLEPPLPLEQPAATSKKPTTARRFIPPSELSQAAA